MGSAVAVARRLRRIHTQSRTNGTSSPPIPSTANLAKPVAVIQHGLHLLWGEHPGQLLRRLQRDHPPRFRLALADVVQKRPPATARTTDLPRCQQLADGDPAPRGMGIKHSDRRKLAIHSRLRAVMLN